MSGNSGLAGRARISPGFLGRLSPPSACPHLRWIHNEVPESEPEPIVLPLNPDLGKTVVSKEF